MRAVISEILPLALVVTLSPINVIAAILLLFSKRPVAAASSYLGGFIVGVTAIIGGAVVFANIVDRSPNVAQDHGVGWIKLIFGIVLLVLAVRKFRGRPRPGEVASLPGWMDGIASFTPLRALRTGLVVGALNPKNIAIGLTSALTIATAELSTQAQLVTVGLYVFVAVLGVAAPIFVMVFLGDRAEGILQGWREWLEHNNTTVMSVLFLVFGVVLVSQGISGA